MTIFFLASNYFSQIAYLNFSKKLVFYFIMAPKTGGRSKSSFFEVKRGIKIQCDDEDTKSLIDFTMKNLLKLKMRISKASIGINVLLMLMNERKKVILL